MRDSAIYNFTVSETNETINFSTEENEVVEFSADTRIEVVPIPPNYGLITWNGSVLTVS